MRWGVWVVCRGWQKKRGRTGKEGKLAVNSDTLPGLIRRCRFLLSAAV